IHDYEPSAPLFHLADGRAISQARFCAQAVALARQWPTASEVVNLCEDRHRFMLALVAASLRGAVTLLPPSHGADHLASLQRRYPDAAVIDDIRVPAVGRWQGEPPRIDMQRPSLIMFTSGSTGLPRQHLKSWADLLATVNGSSTTLGLRGRRVSLV